jgi:hypothetical protein
VPPSEQAQELARERERFIAAVFHVLGDCDANRSDDQRIVWEWLESLGHAKAPSFQPDHITGAFDPIRAALTDGRRSYFLAIQSVIESGYEKTDVTVTKGVPNA